MNVCTRASDAAVPFYTIPFRSVFVETHSAKEVFMKLDTSYNIDGEDYNAVSLQNGQLVHFGDTERVILPKKDPELIVEY